MDILLNKQGDINISETGDILLKNSVAQKIKIRLQWFLGEWRWNKEEGLPYFDSILAKNPNLGYIEGIIRQKIFEVIEVTEVKNVQINFDKINRVATIDYVACTDFEIIKEEVKIGWENMA